MAAEIQNQFIACVHALVGKFRRQRPLRGGSLLITILGDAIAPRGGSIALSSLIRLAQPFGLTERLVRTSIARLANEQWVSSERSGRSSYYTLTSQGRLRFAEATRRIYGAAPTSWDGQWTLVVVPPDLKKKRDTLREELSWLGFGQLTSGVFAHPSRAAEDIPARVAKLVAAGQLVVMQGSSVADVSNARLVAMGWDFRDLARRYRRFIQMFDPADAALHDGAAAALDGETCFILRTLLLHEYRKIHLRDPLLPAALLPDAWVGTDAYELCRGLYQHMFTQSEHFLSATVQTMAGPLPAPGLEIFDRFGGLPAK